MSTSPWRILLVVLLLSLICSPATAQYLYIDANRDGAWSTDDWLNPDTTTVLVWLDTNHDRDGSTRVCNDHTGAASSTTTLNVFSYDLILHATGGTVTYSNFTSPGFNANGTEYQSDTDATFHRARPLGSTLSGLRLLGYVTVTVESGSPGIAVASGSPIDPTAYGTGFGTDCDGSDFPNTYVRGVDWFDTDGVPTANVPPMISTPVSASGIEGTPIDPITATATDADVGNTLIVTQVGMPQDLTFTAVPGVSPQSATISGTPGFDDAGAYTVTWTVDDGSGGLASGTTALSIEDAGQAPLVSAPLSAAGSASHPISFTAAATDPENSGISSFGASGMPPGAIFVPGETPASGVFYWVPDPSLTGTFPVTFTANNSAGTSQAVTNVSVTAPDGPRRPRVAAEFLTLRPGMESSERLMTQMPDGRVFVHAFLVGAISTEELEARGVLVDTRIGRLMTIRCLLDSLPGLFQAPDIDALEAPGFCEPLLDASTVDVRAAGLRSRAEPAQGGFKGQTGKGVVVGIVDTGIDVLNRDFRRFVADDSTRLIGYWDQNLANDGPGCCCTGFFAPVTRGYDHSLAQIQTGGDPKSPDTEEHGTHVAGIAAGNGYTGAGCDTKTYAGVAPEADLCIVKMRPLSVTTNEVLASDIIDGVRYVFSKAKCQNKPAVVNISYGTNKGPHNGLSFIDMWMGRLTEEYGPGSIIVAAVGNENSYGLHARSSWKVGEAEVSFDVPQYTESPGPGDSFLLSGWFSTEDTISVTVVSPLAEEFTGPVWPGGSVGPTNGADGAVSISVGSVPCTIYREYDCGENEITIKVDDSNGQPPEPGIWRILFNSPTTPSRGYADIDMYIQNLEQYGGLEGLPIFFESQGGRNPGRSVMSPASADSVIAVGAYVTKTCWKTNALGSPTLCEPNLVLGDIAPYSNRGPRRDGVTKPDISAPGSVIASTRSGDMPHVDNDSLVLYDDSHYVLQGTSMAAPHVTGAVALLLASDSSAYPSDVKARLMSTARRDQFFTSDTTWGAGKLDVEALLSPVMSVQVLTPAKGDTAMTRRYTPLQVRVGSTGADSVVFSLGDGGCFYYLTQLARWPLDTKQTIPGNTVVDPGYAFPDSLATTTGSERRIRVTAYGRPRFTGGPRDTLEAFSDSFFAIAVTTLVGVASENSNVPARFSLAQNAPNPFNPVTTIQFDIAEPGPVTLRIYSVDGRRVRTLVGRPLTPGQYRLTWNGEDERGTSVASGIYFCEATSGGRRLVRKMTVLK